MGPAPGRPFGRAPRRTLAIGALLLLADCTVGPDYRRPPTSEAEGWQEPLRGSLTGAAADREQLASWWSRLEDPLLDDLVSRALAENLDLRAAHERVRAARGRRDVAEAGLFPTLRARLALSPKEPPSSTSKQATGLEAVWTPDPFGALRRGVEAALGDLGASEEDLRAARVNLAAEVVQSYVDLRALQARIAIALQNLEAQTETAQIASWRAQAGLTTALDVERAQTNALQTRSQIPELRADLERAKNRLAILVGEIPGSLSVAAREGVATAHLADDVEQVLRQRRRIQYGRDDFSIRDMTEVASAALDTTRALTRFVGALAAVSMFVGGIGIMNIMLVSVTERTQEIGIRLAVGARERDVQSQFLAEAAVLTSLGGLAGIAVGTAAAIVGAHVLRVPFVPQPGIMLAAFAASAAVGLAFGYYPARRAARLDPIHALQHE